MHMVNDKVRALINEVIEKNFNGKPPATLYEVIDVVDSLEFKNDELNKYIMDYLIQTYRSGD